MTPQKRLRWLRAAVKEYRDAYADLTWIGSKSPDEHEYVESRYKLAKQNMNTLLKAIAGVK